MVNKNRVVPVQKIDFLSLVGTIMKLAGTTYALITGTDGAFEVTGSGSVGNKLANEPVKSIDFKTGVTAATVYFVPDYDFKTILTAGAESTISDSGIDLDEIKLDGISLYSAALSSGSVIITEVTPQIS